MSKCYQLHAQEDVQQFPSLSNIALPLLDPMTLELDTGTVPGTSSSATASTSAFSLEKCIKPEH